MTGSYSAFRLLLALSACCWSVSLAFAPPRFAAARRSSSVSSRVNTALAASADASSSSLVVISPPGGVGEVAACKAASMGSSVWWFVVSPTNTDVVLSQYALDEIAAAGGSVQLAGADAASLMLPRDDAGSSLAAVAAWCGQAPSTSALVCTLDGVTDNDDDKESRTVWTNAIKVAAKEACGSLQGTKVAILSEEEDDAALGEEANEDSDGIGGFIGNLIGGTKAEIPATLVQAMTTILSSDILVLRHGQLFGTPESSPNFSALVGGPRRSPELCDEYSMRSVRVDPTVRMGRKMSGDSTRSSRHAVGEAAALMALNMVPTTPGLDVCVTSLRGTDPTDLETWQGEFDRSLTELSSTDEVGAQLFAADFGSVPNVERLADWLATKWAPAVLRTYDIAAIRTGARPVSAKRVGDDTVEVVWQQLQNMETVTVGKLVLTVSDKGLVAARAPGDGARGFGTTSRKPLNGETVLVRRLADAVSQAMEKGLAVKPKAPKKKPAPKPEPVAASPVVTSIESSGTVPQPTKETSQSGPRQAGARRSKERARGTKRKKKDT